MLIRMMRILRRDVKTHAHTDAYILMRLQMRMIRIQIHIQMRILMRIEMRIYTDAYTMRIMMRIDMRIPMMRILIRIQTRFRLEVHFNISTYPSEADNLELADYLSVGHLFSNNLLMIFKLVLTAATSSNYKTCAEVFPLMTIRPIN